jgi:hypothetical protein
VKGYLGEKEGGGGLCITKEYRKGKGCRLAKCSGRQQIRTLGKGANSGVGREEDRKTSSSDGVGEL